MEQERDPEIDGHHQIMGMMEAGRSVDDFVDRLLRGATAIRQALSSAIRDIQRGCDGCGQMFAGYLDE